MARVLNMSSWADSVIPLILYGSRALPMFILLTLRPFAIVWIEITAQRRESKSIILNRRGVLNVWALSNEHRVSFNIYDEL